jgi:ribosomal protein S15P/S13E
MWQVTTLQSALKRGSHQRRYDTVDAGWSIVLAAAVTGSFGLLTVLIQKLKKENTKDHEVVMGLLKMVYKKQGSVEYKIDKVSDQLGEHIKNHPK